MPPKKKARLEFDQNSVVTPVKASELDDLTSTIFQGLIDGVVATREMPYGRNWPEEYKRACEDLNQVIIQAVAEHGVLSRVIVKELNDWSLLLLACENLHTKWSHPAIKILIDKNPFALVWRHRDIDDCWGGSTIHAIARHDVHCRLMPWIAETYPWVFDHHVCSRRPPTFEFVEQYSRGNCHKSWVHRFFQAYPNALSQKSSMGDTPLGAILGGMWECDADLIKWMAEQYPKSMKPRNGENSVLQHVCDGIFEYGNYGNDSIETIKYFIRQCPELVVWESEDRTKTLPIHYLTMQCDRRVVQDAVIVLLKAYPESYTIHARYNKAPCKFPFIKRIMPLIDKEMELKESISMLADAWTNFHKATSYSNNPLLHGVSNILDSWCKDRLGMIEVDLQGLPAQVEAIQKEFEGPIAELPEIFVEERGDFNRATGDNPEWVDDEGDESEASSDDSEDSDCMSD